MKKIFFFASINSLKKGVGSRSVSQRYGSADPNPDAHQNNTVVLIKTLNFGMHVGQYLIMLPDSLILQRGLNPLQG
jgi:hypothetical protein